MVSLKGDPKKIVKDYRMAREAMKVFAKAMKKCARTLKDAGRSSAKVEAEELKND